MDLTTHLLDIDVARIVKLKFLLLTMLIFFSICPKIFSGDFKHKCLPERSKSGWCFNYSCEKKTYQNDSINNFKRYCLGERINMPAAQVNETVTKSHKTIDLEILKKACESIGFIPKTESFGECVLKLSERKDLTLTKLDTKKKELDLTKFNNYVCRMENAKSVKSVKVINLTRDYLPLERTSEKDSFEYNLISRADSYCKAEGSEEMDFAYYQGGKFNFTCKNKNINTNTDVCITKYYAPREFMFYSYQEKNDFSLNELSLIEVPRKQKRSYSKVQTYSPPKPSNSLFEDLLSAGLIIGGAYLLGNALSSPSSAIAPGTTIINRVKPSNKMIYGPYETPFGY